MAIRYKQCLFCGSRNVASIMYGEPKEAYPRHDKGKVILGGCVVHPDSPEYHCNECGREWNRQEAFDHAYDRIKGMKATVGGYPDGQFEVNIDFETGKVEWRHFTYDDEKLERKTLSPSEIENFRQDLKFAGLLDWKSEYVEPFTMDGTSWSITVRRNGRTIKKYGQNRFPEGWKEFREGISTFTGKPFY